MDNGNDQAGVVEPGLDLEDEAEYGLPGLAGAEALLTRTVEQRKKLSSELQAILQKNEKELPKELKEILASLGPYSNTIDVKGAHLMMQIIDLSETGYTWVETTITTMSSLITFINIIRYFYNKLILPILKNSLNVESRELHIVLVGEGRFNDQVRPADWLIPGSCITDMILYSPWNCRIDPKVAYGIATGDLQPWHRDFRNNPTMQQQPVPNHWNSIRAQHQQPFPEIILGPLNSTADCLTQITALENQKRLYQNSNRFIIPYPPGGDLADFLPEIPLYKIITVIEILLNDIMAYKATIHLAADFKYRGAKQPDVEMLNDQYAFTPDGTVMTTRDMQFNDLEFPMLYNLFRSMFRPETPQ